MSKNSNTMNTESENRLTFKQVARQIKVLNKAESDMLYSELYQFVCETLSRNWHIVAGSKLSIKKRKSRVLLRLQHGDEVSILGELHGIYSSPHGEVIMDWRNDVAPSAIEGYHCYLGSDLYNLVDRALERFANEEGLKFVRKFFSNRLIIIFNLDKFEVEIDTNPPSKPEKPVKPDESDENSG